MKKNEAIELAKAALEGLIISYNILFPIPEIEKIKHADEINEAIAILESMKEEL